MRKRRRWKEADEGSSRKKHRPVFQRRRISRIIPLACNGVPRVNDRFSATVILSVVIFLMFPVVGRSNGPANLFQVRRAIEAFCSYEFRGDTSDERARQVIFSPEREKRERKRAGEALPWVIFWDSEPLVIVESFNVIRVEPAGEGKANAYVDYNVVAESRGNGNIVKIRKPHGLVKYQLVWVWSDTRWMVVDPPGPRISKEALIRHYEEYFEFVGSDWINDPRLTDVQRKSYADRLKTLETLRSL